MIASKNELFAVLRQYNPWWSSGRFPDLPIWRRAAFHEIAEWLEKPPGGRALFPYFPDRNSKRHVNPK
jgi:hypothetical protein